MNVKTYITDFIAANARPMNEADFDICTDDIGIGSFVYNYGGIAHSELEGEAALDSYLGDDLSDYVTIRRDRLADMLDNLPDDKPTGLTAEQRSALITHMTNAMHQPLVESITMYTENGALKTLNHSEYVAAVVASIIDFIDNA